MEILAYQAFIALTLFITRFVAPSYLALVAMVWTVLTVLNVFWPPLVIIQLIVIWGTHSMLAGATAVSAPAPPANSKEITPAAKASTSIHDPMVRPQDQAANLAATEIEAAFPQSPHLREIISDNAIKAFAKAEDHTRVMPKVPPDICAIPTDAGCIQSPIWINSKIRDIRQLVHFTRLDNLESIMEKGLLSVDSLSRANLQFVQNDVLRLDRRLSAVSLSITHPNAKMFYKYRKLDPTDKWVVIMLDPSVMWEKRCLFFARNAADHRMRTRTEADLSSSDAFEAMFDPLDDLASRSDQHLLPADPTDPQAEVMVLEDIEPKYINKVIFNSSTGSLDAQYVDIEKIEIVHPNKGAFASRSYVRKQRDR